MSEIGIPLPPQDDGELDPFTPGGDAVAPPLDTPVGLRNPVPVPPVVAPSPGGGGSKGPNFILWLLILALILLAASLSKFFNWMMQKTLGRLWHAAGKPSVTPQSVTQAISSTLGPAALGVDPDVGTGLVNLAATANQLGGTFKHMGWAIHAQANAISRLTRSHEETQQVAGAAVKSAKQAKHEAQTANATATATRQQSESAQKAAQATQHATTEHIHHVIEPELDKLRHAIPELKKGNATTWDELSKYIEAGGATAAIAATAYGLARLGGSWIRCDTNQALGRQMCGNTGNTLKKLLEGGLPLLALGDVCLVIKGATKLLNSGAVQGSLSFGVDAVAGLLSCTGADKAAPLNSAYYAPGKLTYLGTAGALSV